MRSTEPAALGVREAADAVRAGTVSPVELVEASLAQIAALDGQLLAWAHVDAAGARAIARERESEARGGRVRGPLHGVPVGVKDIFDVAGMPTTGGARAFAHTQPTADAAAVARIRAAGAIVLGKTVTTEFAYRDPVPTRNPWNHGHTPGGSSAGSAAAVAARMAPLGLGSQTVGSVLRPAAYCGVVGFKGTHGLVPVGGVIPLAWSLDHVGVLTRSVADAALGAGARAARPRDAGGRGARRSRGRCLRPRRRHRVEGRSAALVSRALRGGADGARGRGRGVSPALVRRTRRRVQPGDAEPGPGRPRPAGDRVHRGQPAAARVPGRRDAAAVGTRCAARTHGAGARPVRSGLDRRRLAVRALE